jgi:hypothetical protein
MLQIYMISQHIWIIKIIYHEQYLALGTVRVMNRH